MIDWTITAGNVLTLIAMAGGALAAFFSLRGRLDMTQTRAKEAFDIAKQVRDDLQIWKLDVAQNYIRSEAMEKLEERQIARETRILTTLEGLGSRIDRLVERMDQNTPRRRASGNSS